MSIHHIISSEFAKANGNWLNRIFGNSTADYIVNSIIIVVSLIVLWRYFLEPLIDIARGFRNFHLLRTQPLVRLVITPPAQSEKSPLATEHLFTVIERGLGWMGVVRTFGVDETEEEELERDIGLTRQLLDEEDGDKSY